MRRPHNIIAILGAALLVLAVGAMAGPHEGYLGVYTQTIDKDLQEAFDLASDEGVVIKDVVPDSPADQVGIKPGDIILEFNGRKVRSADHFYRLVRANNADEKVDMTLMRDGDRKELNLTLGDAENFDDDNWILGSTPPVPKSRSQARTWYFDSRDTEEYNYIGVSLENLNDQLGNFFGADDGNGALVREVVDDSPAQKAGLKAGDVIVAIDGKDIEELDDVQRRVRQADKGDQLDITVLRDKKEMTVAVEVEEAPDSYSWSPGKLNYVPFDNFQFFAPQMKGLLRGNFLDDEDWDDDVDNDVRQELKESMNELREELKELRESRQDYRNEIDQLKKDLKKLEEKLD